MTSYDAAYRKQAKRSGRETGCWAYISGEELAKAGYGPGEPPPFYRATVSRRSRNAATAMVSLYRER